MNPSYVGAVWMFGGNFAPSGFQFCDGRLVAISDNDTLYSLLGTTYGGDGVQTFGLPDLRGRVCIGQGQGSGLSNYLEGQISGTENATLSTTTMAAHTHLLNAGTNSTSPTPTANTSYINAVNGSTAPVSFFSDVPTSATLVNGTIGVAGQSTPFNIVQPVLAVNYVIALYGIYPSRS